jgi:enamine deaminase RidA (YjgF/YER057c/UK114 family)
MAKQVGIALGNLTTVLAGAGMTMADVVKLIIYRRKARRGCADLGYRRAGDGSVREEAG